MTGYYSSSSSHCDDQPCRFEQGYHRYPCSGGFCCQKTVECTRIFVEGQLTLDANDNQIPCCPSISNGKPAITGCERETQTIVDFEQIPSSPCLLQSAAIAIPCITCHCCCQCCCKTNPASKERPVGETTPTKKTFTHDVYSQTSDVTVRKISSASQTDPPSTSKVGTQTEKPLCSSCSSQTRSKRTADKSTMTSVANLMPINNDPSRILNSFQTKSPRSLFDDNPLLFNDNASFPLNNNPPIQMSPGTNDIILSDWIPALNKELIKRKNSRQALLKMLLVEEQKQKKRLGMLKRKNQLRKAMSKFKDNPKRICSSSSDSFYSSSSSSSSSPPPDLCEDLVLSKKSPLSLAQLENSSLPPKLCQKVMMKRPLCPNHLSETNKLGQRLLLSDYHDILLTSTCAKTRSRKKKCNYDDKTIKQFEDRNSLSIYNENIIPEKNKRNPWVPTNDIFKPVQNLESFVNDCISQNGNENVNSNLSPSLKECFISTSQYQLECEEVLRSLMNRMAAHKKKSRLAGGRDKTVPVDRFPSCHRVMLSGSISRIINCLLASHMRSLSELLEKPTCDGQLFRSPHGTMRV